MNRKIQAFLKYLNSLNSITKNMTHKKLFVTGGAGFPSNKCNIFKKTKMDSYKCKVFRQLLFTSQWQSFFLKMVPTIQC